MSAPGKCRYGECTNDFIPINDQCDEIHNDLFNYLIIQCHIDNLAQQIKYVLL